jgi:hypothetical protein
MGEEFRSPAALLSRGEVLGTHCGPSGSGEVAQTLCEYNEKGKDPKVSVAAGN